MKFVAIPITSAAEDQAMHDRGLDFCDGCAGRFAISGLKKVPFETREGLYRPGLACWSCWQAIAGEKRRSAERF